MNEETMSRFDSTASTERFITPASSMGDLMSISPKRLNSHYMHEEVTTDLLTDTHFEDICDVTMQEIPGYEDVFVTANDLDYLSKCTDNSNKSSVTNLDSGKESLFVKFDPLYARNKEAVTIHQNRPTNMPESDNGYETGSTASTTDNVFSPNKCVSASVLANKEKPMQKVTPAINHTIASAHSTQSRAIPPLMRSISAIMSPVQVAIDTLVNITGTTPPAPRITHSPQRERHPYDAADRFYSLRTILQNQEHEIHELRQENRQLKYKLEDADNKISQLKDLEEKVKKLGQEKQNLIEKQSELVEQINEKIRSNKQMSVVMEEYEKTISSLISQQQKQNLQQQELELKLTSERDEAVSHLTSMEASFNDLLAKYEKCKKVIIDTKEREKTFEQNISEYEKAVKKYESLYENLKKVTSESLSKANKSLKDIEKSHSADITRYNATIKKQEVMILSLQESLVQKERDNQELSAICDELLSKVH